MTGRISRWSNLFAVKATAIMDDFSRVFLEPDSPQFRAWCLKVCRRLCPDHSDSQLLEAAQNLQRYCAVLWKIQRRLKSEGKLNDDLEPTLEASSSLVQYVTPSSQLCVTK